MMFQILSRIFFHRIFGARILKAGLMFPRMVKLHLANHQSVSVSLVMFSNNENHTFVVFDMSCFPIMKTIPLLFLTCTTISDILNVSASTDRWFFGNNCSLGRITCHILLSLEHLVHLLTRPLHVLHGRSNNT